MIQQDPQDLLELTLKKKIMKKKKSFHHRDWNVKVRSQEISRLTGKFGLVVLKEAGKG